MASASIGSLLRRGVELGQDHLQNGPKVVHEIPTWAAVLLGATTILFLLLSFSVEYTYNRVIPTLLIVESPEAIVFEPLPSDDVDGTINKPTDPELLIAKTRPITSSFRDTMKHLRNKGGRRARYRGMAMYLVTSTISLMVSASLGSILPFLATVIADVLCSQLLLGWTHIVISDPNPKPWYRRIPGYSMWRKVAGPTAILSLATQVAVVLPTYLATTTKIIEMPRQDAPNSEIMLTILKGSSVMLLTFALTLFVVIPAKVILTRVQASLLPEELETIVPFDRSFGGRVVPSIVGGSGMIGMRDAWTTFDWNARVRLFKAYLKATAIQVAVIFLAVITLTAEVMLVLGKDFKNIFPEDGSNDSGRI